MKVNSFLNFDTASLTADPLSVGCNQRNCAVGASTQQRNTVPSLDSFVRLNFDFLSLLNLLQLSSWICCVCILILNLLWHNSLSLHIYSLLFPHPCSYCHQQVDKSSKPQKHVQSSRKQKHPYQKKKSRKEKNLHWIAVSLMHSVFSWDFVR